MRAGLGTLGAGLGRLGAAGRSSSLAAETRTLIAAMTTPPTAERAAQIDTLIRALKAGGIWTLLDVLYVMAAADSQASALNWKNPSSLALTFSGSPIFTADRGYTGNGSSAAVASAYNPTTFTSPNYVQNAATAGCYMRATGTTNGAVEFGVPLCRLQLTTAAANYGYRANDATTTTAAAKAAGHWAVQRTGASARAAYKNGVQVASDTQASTVITTGTVTLLSFGGAAFSEGQISAFYAGGVIDPAVMHTALMAYLVSVGAAP